MPRPLRQTARGFCYHVLNRGNGWTDVFHKAEDYQALVRLMQEACERLPMRILGYCLMPNHFHLVLWPNEDGVVSLWMQWLMSSHVRRYHRRYHGSGHVWQGRFKSFPVQSDEHLLTVLRYVERNPLRRDLVQRAEAWEWGSLWWWRRRDESPAFLTECPVARPDDWVDRVNRPETEAELTALRGCLTRGKPYGSQTWQPRTGRRLGLESTLRPRGRPRKGAKK